MTTSDLDEQRRKVEELKKKIEQASVWVLIPQDERWSKYKWVQPDAESLKKIRTAISNSKSRPTAGNFYTLDLEWQDMIKRGQGLVVFQVDGKLIAFKRRPIAVEKNTLALVNIEIFDPAQRKIEVSPRHDLFGIELPESFDTLFAFSRREN